MSSVTRLVHDILIDDESPPDEDPAIDVGRPQSSCHSSPIRKPRFQPLKLTQGDTTNKDVPTR